MKNPLGLRGRPHSSSKRGFAVVIALTLLAFIVLLLLTLTAMTQIERQVSTAMEVEKKAEQNALMALKIAMGELQRYAGKDQVATAPSAIIGDIPGNIFAGVPTVDGAHDSMLNYTGVWDVEKTRTTTGDGSTAEVWEASDLQTQNVVPSWLVSGRSPERDDGYTPITYSPDSGSAMLDVAKQVISSQNEGIPENNEEWPYVGDVDPETGLRDYVVMVTPKADESNNLRHYYPVVAGAENILSSSADDPTQVNEGDVTGRYAWWVSDESFKAKVNMVNPYDEQMGATGVSEEEKPLNLLTPQGGRGLGAMDRMDAFLDLDNDDLGKVMNTGHLRVLKKGSQEVDEVLDEKFHDITTYSRMVIADTFNGGLRKDLTAGLQEGNDALYQDELARIFPPMGGSSTARDPGGPRWEQLRSFVNLHKEVTGGGTSYSVDPRPQTADEMGVYPVLTMLQNFYIPAFAKKTTPGTIFDPSEKTEYTATIHISPAVVLWNPYDVKINSADYTVILWRNTMPHTGGGYARHYFHDRIRLPTAYVTSLSQQGGGGGGINTAQLAQARGIPFAFKHKTRFTIRGAEFEPGQALVFYPLGHTEIIDPNQVDTNQQEMLLTEEGYLGGSFYSDKLTAEGNPDTLMPLSVPTKPGELRTEIQSSRRGAMEFYLGRPEDGQMLQWFKRMNTRNYHSGGAVATVYDPIEYNEQPPAGPLVTQGESSKMWGRKFKMRVPSTRWDGGTEEHFPVNNNSLGTTQKTKKIKWLANYNPRSPTVGRSVMEWEKGDQVGEDGGTAYFTPPLFHTDVFSPGRTSDVFDVAEAGGGETYIGYSNDKGGTRAVIFELPKSERHFLSIGQFMHAHLTVMHSDREDFWNTFPGTGQNTRGGYGYSNEDFFSDCLQPAYPIGNSLGDPRIPPNRLYREAALNDNSSVNFQGVYYDMSYKLNEALWNKYFVSSVPHNTTLTREGNGRYEALPNSRMIPYNDPSLEDMRDFDRAAASLMVDGPFNVNSVSVEAWKALLGSFLGVPVETVNGIEASTDRESPIVRMGIPHGGAITGDDGESVIEDQDAYTGFRKLSREEIQELAEAITSEIQRRYTERRHPFLHLGDFVNRQLGGSADEASEEDSIYSRGALSLAIEKTTINEAFGTLDNPDEDVIEIADLDPVFDNRAAAAGSVAEGVPGYLTQADVLARVGPVLTTRGDTFVIRAYGEVRNPTTNEIEAQKWVEATVQRLPEFIDDTNEPWADVQELSEVNEKFGRRFKFVSGVRWLNRDEI